MTDANPAHWNLLRFKGPWSRKKKSIIKKRIKKVFDRFLIDTVVLKELDMRTSRDCAQLFREIHRICERGSIRVHRVTLQELKDYWLPGRMCNRLSLVKHIKLLYPDLYSNTRSEDVRPMNYIKLYEAVGLAKMYCIHPPK